MPIRNSGKRKRRQGVSEMPIRIYHGDDDVTQAEARAFWLCVDIPPNESECWNWNVPRQRNRKGKPNPSPRYTFKGRCYQAHTFAWELRHGDVPEGMKVRRTCRNLLCVNPAHMELGTGGKPHYLTASERRSAMHLWRASSLTIEAIGERFGVGPDPIYELIRGDKL